jgi:hypothetical protein
METLYIMTKNEDFITVQPTRAVKTGGPFQASPFGLCRAGLKSPDKKRATKIRPETGPVWAFGPVRIFF